MKTILQTVLSNLALCLLAFAEPKGICLHAYSPEAPADKIECFEFEKSETTFQGTRFFLTNGQPVVINDYQNRGVIAYPIASTPLAPTLQRFEALTFQSPATRQFLNPWILKIRNTLGASAKQATTIVKLPSIPLPDGTVLKECHATKLAGTIVTIIHADGVKKIDISTLSEALKTTLNLADLKNSAPILAADPSLVSPEKITVGEISQPSSFTSQTKTESPKPILTDPQVRESSATPPTPPVLQTQNQPASDDRQNSGNAISEIPDKKHAEAVTNSIISNATTTEIHIPPVVVNTSASAQSATASITSQLASVPVPWYIAIGLIAITPVIFTSVRKRKEKSFISPIQLKFKPRDAIHNPLIKFYCPNCESKLSASAEEYGKSVDCPSCGVSFVVPSESSDIKSSTLITANDSLSKPPPIPSAVSIPYAHSLSSTLPLPPANQPH